MVLSYKEWLIKQKSSSSHRHSLLALHIQEDFYKLKGLLPTNKNLFSSRSLNEFISLKQNEFDLHLLKLAVLDDKKFNFEKIVNLPYSHKGRNFYILLISLLKNKTALVEHLIKTKLITDINKKIISSFTLYHLILKTDIDLSICNPLLPNLKFMIPPLFNAQYCNFDPFIPVTRSIYRLLLVIKKSVDIKKEFNCDIFRKSDKKIEEKKNERKEEIILKSKKEFYEFYGYKMTVEEMEILNKFTKYPFVNPNLLYPIDFAVMKGDEQEFCKILVGTPTSLKYSKHAFYFCEDPNLGLKLYYYNCNYNQDALLFYVYKNNFGMVVLLLALGIQKKYLRVAALLCAKLKHFTLLRLLMNADKFSGDNIKSDKSILKLLCLSLVGEKNNKYEFDKEENKEDFFDPKIISCFSYELICELSKYSDKPFFRNNVNFNDFTECTFDPKPILSFVKKLSWIKNKRWVETKAPWWWNSQELHGKNYASVIDRFEISVRVRRDQDQIIAVNDLIQCGVKIEKKDLV